MARIARILLVLGLVLGGYLLNQLEWLEREIMELRARADGRPAASDLVLVQIDEPSLREYPVWPWPRRLYAKALDRLVAAGAQQVAFDIDFSSHSRPDDDAILAQSLKTAGIDIILAIFRQPVRRADGTQVFLESKAIAPFEQHGRSAAFNVRPDADGRVRRVGTRERWDHQIVPYYAALIAGRHGGALTDYYIDYSIDIGTIPTLRFADVAEGRFDPTVVRGRKVLIGAGALQLGDMVPVPIHGSTPGMVVQALAYSSLATGRAIQRLHPAAVIGLAVLMVLALRLGARFDNWMIALGATVGIMAVTTAGAFVLQIYRPIYVDLAPPLLVAVLDYLTRTLSKIRRQDIELLTQSLALRRRDMFMRLIVENSFDAIFTLKPDGKVLTCNHAAAEILGRPAEDTVGQTIDAFLIDVQFEDGGDLKELLSRRGVYTVTCRNASGKPLSLDLSVGQVKSGEDLVIILLARDITEKRNAEILARRSQQYLSDAIESVDAGLAVFGPDDRLIIANGKYRRDKGLETMDDAKPSYGDIVRMLAKSGHFMASRHDPKAWVDQHMERHRTGDTAAVEQTADGRWSLTSSRRTHDGGTIVVETDITALKQREAELIEARDEAQSADRSKSEFLAQMSHELRTPLNAIIGFSEMMLTEVFGPLGGRQYVGYANDIHSSGTHLLEIVNDVLDMAKIESGKFELHEGSVDLGAVIQTVVRLLHGKAEEKNIPIEVEVPAGPITVQADERIARQILINLLSNAVKFTPEGGKVGIAARLLDDGGAAVTISDTGIGMSAEDLVKAMAPFGQAQSSLAREYEGTGLGLPLAARFIELHGGRLDIDSATGQGTRATIVFPADRVVTSATADKKSASA